MEKVLAMLNIKMLTSDAPSQKPLLFMKLKTDQERIIFTLNLLQEYGITFAATGTLKNAEESEKWLEQGNDNLEAYYVKDVRDNMASIEMLKLYTTSIAFAPCPSVHLALGYANRSGVLFELGLYSECIQDIDRALVLVNFLDHQKAMLRRKKECELILKTSCLRNAIEVAQREVLDKMPLNDTKRKFKAEFDVLRNKLEQLSLPTTDAKVVDPIDLPAIESYNKEVPYASDAVAIKYNKQYGRHLVATRNISPGEVIAVEKPYSLMLLQENVQTHCSNCLSVCWAPIPCNYCTYVMYCSEECRNIEWKKCHDIECTVFPILIEYDMNNFDLFSVRLLVLTLREAKGDIEELRTMMKDLDEHDDPRTKGFSPDGKLHSDKYIGVCSLETNTEKRNFRDIFQLSVKSSFILYYLATRTVLFGTKLDPNLIALAENNDFTFFGGLILRYRQIISCNTACFTEIRNERLTQRGMAIMPFGSLNNHSCNPNVCRQSKPEYIVTYALYPIRKGEQVLDNYGKHYAITPRAARQRKLSEQYYFDCDCIACNEDWPLSEKLKSYQILVRKTEDKAKIREALRKFSMYVDLVTESNVQNKDRFDMYKEELLNVVKVLHDYAMPCAELNKVITLLVKLVDLNGNKIPQI